jgi:TPR repeat protein
MGWRAFALGLVVMLAAVGCDVRRPSRLAVRHDSRVAECGRDVAACRARCESGDAPTCNLLGVVLEVGAGTTSRPRAAAELYQRGCDADYPPSCTNLGWLVLRGRGVEASPAVALVLFQRAYDGYARSCSAGFGSSCVSAADAIELLDRDDVDQESIALLERGCSLGETRACERISTR